MHESSLMRVLVPKFIMTQLLDVSLDVSAFVVHCSCCVVTAVAKVTPKTWRPGKLTVCQLGPAPGRPLAACLLPTHLFC